MLKFLSFIILILIFLFVNCDRNSAFEQYKAIPKSGWHSDSIHQFIIPKMDTLKNHNLFFSIRNNNEYSFSNLFVIASIDFPNGKRVTDTLEYQMALPTGEWLGTGGISVKENKLWYKENFKFNESGNYKISLSQAMRKNGSTNGVLYLKGITDVGLRVETVEKP